MEVNFCVEQGESTSIEVASRKGEGKIEKNLLKLFQEQIFFFTA